MVTLPDPEPGAGEVLVEVRAAGVNRLDVLQRRGPGLLPGFALPHVPGTDVAGVVVAVGPGVATRAVGDRVVVDPSLTCGACTPCADGQSAWCTGLRVVGASRQGGYAELVAVPETHVHAVPQHIGMEEAAAVPTVYGMAWQALMVRGGLRAGETLLVHGAGSGITIAATQIARRSGARVIVTSGSDEKLAKAAKLGVDATVNHRREDLAARVRELTDGRGADIVLDHVGPALFQPSLAALRLRGRMVFCGNTTGPTAEFSLVDAYHRGLTLIGSESYDRPAFGEMLEWYWSAGCEAVIDSVFPLEEAAEAHRRLEGGESFGKILLTP
ncbi:NADPH:quinone reductase-like Zn-dependent oxidoreductase [Thermocatellispora tengchongensis]|uniref:NADPH:quinone reductase-like Zn-dependent oxidoreductase n=1 Tax=Thermocatellispora tengchongensis TaxID=1073253 RepID=A0A840NVZ3_9ACTN|nr:zinc-binding dehydrogenase [Thermocatellispora tengchongensis]MBB5130979.1 NADPH:quinone reductase-like Zn-dependent oxidoreductase [Thermocatellispora tengchongensis]